MTWSAGEPPGYRWRRLAPQQEHAIRMAHQAGVATAALAGEYGVSVRTIQRIVTRPGAPLHYVAVGGWSTHFEATELGPVQVEPWRPVEADD